MNEAATHEIETQALIAGAWARGLADAFSLLGLPAIFLDAGGRVLHVGREAAPAFGATLGVDRRRLVVADRTGRAALQQALAGRDRATPRRVRLDDSGRVAHILPIPRSSGQVLDSVVLLLDADDSASEVLAASVLARANRSIPLAH